jgi:hypothetical protein
MFAHNSSVIVTCPNLFNLIIYWQIYWQLDRIRLREHAGSRHRSFRQVDKAGRSPNGSDSKDAGCASGSDDGKVYLVILVAFISWMSHARA